MFDVGFSELIVIAIIALVVVGPERLPKVARTAGHLLGRLQRYVNDVKSDISREMQLDELRKLQSEMQESARNLQHSVDSEIQALEQVVAPVHAAAGELRDALTAHSEPIAQAEEGRTVDEAVGETHDQTVAATADETINQVADGMAGEVSAEANTSSLTPGAPVAKA